MLTELEIKEITAEFAHAPTKASVCVEALNMVQRRRGWISDEVLADIAVLLDMSVHELENVATFYSLIFRKPVGRHVILICDSVSCWIIGFHPLLDYCKQNLGIGFGETTEDKRFTLLPVACLGACDRAPAMMVNNDLYGPVTADMMETIFKKYV
ncbi:MAG: NADH-quinone oxidoreductase subunit NuoE [Nitrospirota bacterium]